MNNTTPISPFYELLFADNPDLFRSVEEKPYQHPYDVLLADEPDPEALQGLLTDPLTGPRPRILAGRLLLNMGIQPQTHQLMGSVVEVGMEGGLDVLAAYADGTARFIHHTGDIIVWESQDTEFMALGQEFFNRSWEVANRIGPWEKPRLPQPPTGWVRLSFLLTDGLYFGPGPINEFFNEPMAKPVLDAATRLMQFLLSKGKKP